jgi:hypothetical protein
MAVERQAAIPCRLAEVASGSWVENDGLAPSGVRTGRGLVSRVSVIGVMVQRQEGSFILDDGTSSVTVRQFDETPIRAQVGDIVLIIGRPREYNNERYLALEICRKLKNPAWVEYRRQELKLWGASEEFVEPSDPRPRASAEPPQVATTGKAHELILSRIKELDQGPGADVLDVTDGVADGDRVLRQLLEDGEVFEIKPGKVKVLE